MTRVLLVDDFLAIRAVQRKALHGIGITHVVEASNGSEAVAALENNSFDLVVTDWNMPEMSGIELLQLIRKIDPELPVIMVTANDMRDKIVEAAKCQVSGYLIKPFDKEQFQKIVVRLLNIPVSHKPASTEPTSPKGPHWNNRMPEPQPQRTLRR